MAEILLTTYYNAFFGTKNFIFCNEITHLLFSSVLSTKRYHRLSYPFNIVHDLKVDNESYRWGYIRPTIERDINHTNTMVIVG